jgi:hypothetical protein
VRNAEQPIGKTARILQVAQLLVGLQEDILANIHRVFAIAQNAQQVVVDALLPACNQLVKGIHFTPLRGEDEIAVFGDARNQLPGSMS